MAAPSSSMGVGDGEGELRVGTSIPSRKSLMFWCTEWISAWALSWIFNIVLSRWLHENVDRTYMFKIKL
jgi:hypothetical protein